MSVSHFLPIITVQPSFQDVISDVKAGQVPDDSFWVSCYKNGSASVHERIQVDLDEVHRDRTILKPKNQLLSVTHDGMKVASCHSYLIEKGLWSAGIVRRHRILHQHTSSSPLLDESSILSRRQASSHDMVMSNK